MTDEIDEGHDGILFETDVDLCFWSIHITFLRRNAIFLMKGMGEENEMEDLYHHPWKGRIS
jgi:hypothetical protein